MSDIFLSYASEDRERVRPLAEALGRQGWEVWWDRDIPPGQTWRSFIQAALAEARCVVVVWSSRSVESHWVIAEADRALKRKLAIVPARIEDVEPPFGFESLQAAELVNWEADESSPAFQALLKGLTAVLGAPSPSEQSSHAISLAPEQSREPDTTSQRDATATTAVTLDKLSPVTSAAHVSHSPKRRPRVLPDEPNRSVRKRWLGRSVAGGLLGGMGGGMSLGW